MKIYRSSLGIILALVIVLSGVFAPYVLRAEEPIVIAAIDPMSGPMKDLGDGVMMSQEYAVDQLNAKGGLLGRPLRLLKFDSQMKPAVAVKHAKKAILEDGAKFIVHSVSSAIGLALSKIAKRYNVIYVDMHAEADQITGSEFTPNVFRTCLSTAMHSRALAYYFASTPHKKYYIICQDYSFGHAVADSFKKVFSQLRPDAEIVGEAFHPLYTKDFGPYVTKILATEPEVIITGNFGVDLDGFIEQARALGMKAVVGSYFLDDPARLNKLRQLALGYVTAECYLSTVKTKKNRQFVKSWQAWYKEHYPKGTHLYLLPYLPANSVNGMYFLAEAIKKAGSVDANKVIKAWEGMSFDGICGKVTMRACDHQIQTPAFVGTIKEDHPQRDICDFPYVGEPTVIPAEKMSTPPEETGNPRCK